MYHKPFTIAVTTCTIFTPKAGDKPAEQQGMMITGTISTSSRATFEDLDFGSKAEVVGALLAGELPVEYPYALDFVRKERCELTVGKTQETCHVEHVEMLSYDNGVYKAKLKIKCPGIKDSSYAPLFKLEKQTVELQINPTQLELVSGSEAAPQKEKKARKPRIKKTDPVFEASGGVDVE